MKSPCEESTLLIDQTKYYLLIIYHLVISIDLPLTLDTPSIWLLANGGGSSLLCDGDSFEIVASSNKASSPSLPDPVAPLELELEAWAESYFEEWSDL